MRLRANKNTSYSSAKLPCRDLYSFQVYKGYGKESFLEQPFEIVEPEMFLLSIRGFLRLQKGKPRRDAVGELISPLIFC
jgi:hypothetical protein